MTYFATTVSLLVLVLLVINARYAHSYNLLCDQTINWIQIPVSNTYNFNHTTCKLSVSASSNSNEKRVIEVSSIFSNASNYPLNFSINGNPYGGNAGFGITFQIQGTGFWGYLEDETSSSTQITYQWLTFNSDTYVIYVESEYISTHSTATHSYTASNIIQIGIQVSTAELVINNGVIFDYVELNALKIPTQTPTNVPTSTPTTNIPTTNNPTTNNPTTTNSLTTLNPTYIPTYQPTTFPTMNNQLECDGNGYIIVISFDYLLNNGMTDVMVGANLLSMTHDTIKNKNESFTNCVISSYVINIKSNINNKAIVNISLCTECDKTLIENNLLSEFIAVTDENVILSVVSDSTVISVDIIKKDNEAEHQYSTTHIISNTKEFVDKSQDNTFWIIMSVLLCIICVCVIFMTVCIVMNLRKDKQREKAENDTIQLNKANSYREGERNEHEIDANIGEINNADDDIVINDDDESPGNDNSTPSGLIDGDIDTIHTKQYYNIKQNMEQVKNWLTKIGFKQYFSNFIENGFDSIDIIVVVSNISELTEIGIDSIQHQNKILNEIRKLKQFGGNDVNVTGGNDDDDDDVIIVYD